MRRPACLPSLLVPRRGLEGVVARFGACLETEDYESVRQDKLKAFDGKRFRCTDVGEERAAVCADSTGRDLSDPLQGIIPDE